MAPKVKTHRLMFLFCFHFKARIGTRHVVTFMLFLGMANAYVMRTNMSVAIVAMVNHTAIQTQSNETVVNECNSGLNSTQEAYEEEHSRDGKYNWETPQQGYLLSSFFYGYVLTQIPFGILAKEYGSKYFLGIGMLINSLFGLLVPISAEWGFGYLMLVRFIQGLGEVSTLLDCKPFSFLFFFCPFSLYLSHSSLTLCLAPQF